MSLLDRKLLRDVAARRGQAITIALVMAAGIAVLVASVSTFESLRSGRDRFYADTRFPQIFATLKRAPLSIAARISEIPNVLVAEPRIVRDVIVDRPESVLPVSARIVSIRNAGEEQLARLYMRRGAAPAKGESRNVAVNEAFAEANQIKPGDSLRIVLNGKLQSFQISGVALSPEYVYSVKSGLPIPDDRLYAVLWIDRSAAEAAFDMKGAFNDVVVSLAPGADPKPVIAALDRLLAPYGSVGAIERRDQPSNRFLEDELNQQRTTSIVVPVIFFAVAAFLLNIALSRVVSAQREQIAALKALGFPTAPLVLHYLKLAGIIVALGGFAGLLGGIAFGRAMMASYHDFFRLPELEFRIVAWSVAAGVGIGLVSASFGALSALLRIVALAPAVAMRPPAPRRFRRSRLEALATARILKPRRIMALRSLAGRPLRTALTILGVAFAVPMTALGLFWRDAIDQMIEVQFNLVERGNYSVTFPRPMPREIIRDLSREPGVLKIEGQRLVPVRLQAAHRAYLTAVIGLPEGGDLRRLYDGSLHSVALSEDGVTLTRRLADRLAVSTGDVVNVEVMEGERRKRTLPVGAIVDETIGMASYMPLGELNKMTGEGAVVSTAAIYVDPSAVAALSGRLKALPAIESVAMKSHTLRSFLDRIAGLVFISVGVLTSFAVIIVVGVVYNSARAGLQDRVRELASLRVLGFTRAEVSRILLGENPCPRPM